MINSPYSLPAFIAPPNANMVTLGSQNIYEMFLAEGIPCELYLECNMMHGLDNCENCGGSTNEAYTKALDNNGNVVCNPCLFDSNFGTSCTEDDCVYDYIAGRGATFFQAIITNNANSLFTLTTKFVNCKNNRIKCIMIDNKECSTNEDPCSQY